MRKRKNPRTRCTAKVDIKPLKSLILKRFPPNHPLRFVLLAERDVLETGDFLAKLETWLNILRVEPRVYEK